MNDDDVKSIILRPPLLNQFHFSPTSRLLNLASLSLDQLYLIHWILSHSQNFSRKTVRNDNLVRKFEDNFVFIFSLKTDSYSYSNFQYFQSNFFEIFTNLHRI